MTVYDIVPALRARGLTLCTAESCTGGLAAKCLTDVPGASAVFKGGVVSYTNEVKNRLLGVSEALLEEHGAVSAPVAAAMAKGAREALQADLALSVTGVAGPDKDDRGNAVGTVFIGLASAAGETVRALHLAGTRDEIRNAAVEEMWRLLEEKGE